MIKVQKSALVAYKEWRKKRNYFPKQRFNLPENLNLEQKEKEIFEENTKLSITNQRK